LRAVEIKLLTDAREEQQDDSDDADGSDDSDESGNSGDSEECPEGKHPNYHEYRSIETNIYHRIHSRAIKKSTMLIRYRILQYLPNSKGPKHPHALTFGSLEIQAVDPAFRTPPNLKDHR
jgi:hypothetical protein